MNSQAFISGVLVVVGVIVVIYCGLNVWQFFSLREKLTKAYIKFISDAGSLGFYATQLRLEINEMVFGGENKIKELEESIRAYKSSLSSNKKGMDPKEILSISENMINIIMAVSLASLVYTTTYNNEETGLLIHKSFLKQVTVAKESIVKLAEVFSRFTYVRRCFPLSLFPAS